MGETKNNFNEPLLSVVIPNYNGARFIRDCLKSVLSQEIDGNLEVIVVDDISPDGSAEIVRVEFPGVRLIENDAKSEFVGSANRGMQAAKGKYVAVLNNDVTVAPGWADAACRGNMADGILLACEGGRPVAFLTGQLDRDVEQAAKIIAGTTFMVNSLNDQTAA